MFWKKEPKKSLSKISRQFALSIPVPKTKEYKTISTLLEDAERWRNVGDAELEKKTWQMISEKASRYGSVACVSAASNTARFNALNYLRHYASPMLADSSIF